MSADPDVPIDLNRYSGGHVVHNMIYKHNAPGNMEVLTAWNFKSIREHNQEIVPPAQLNMHKHPCKELNDKLVRCSLACEPNSRLAYRTSVCHEERKVLMQCLTRNKGWTKDEEEGKAWYKFW